MTPSQKLKLFEAIRDIWNDNYAQLPRDDMVEIIKVITGTHPNDANVTWGQLYDLTDVLYAHDKIERE